MTDLAPSLNPIRPDAPTEIPVIDLAQPRPHAATAWRYAFEQVGFAFITNHGVPQSLIDATFAATAAFHAQPLDAKLALKINSHNIGYLPMQGATTRHSQLNANNKPNLNEAVFFKRDLPPDHPDVIAGLPFRGTNQWPADLPGFRETVTAYCTAMETLGRSLLPLYALALDLPADFFDPAFRAPMFTLRMSHYPAQEIVADNEFGLAPHSDTSFMTLLAENAVPGLSIRLPNGIWIDAPSMPGAILVNGGDMLRRWTNERFLATPHRVINRSGAERYAIPFFMDCDYHTTMTCLPTCHDATHPPLYPPITYAEYMTWYRNLNYAQAKKDS